MTVRTVLGEAAGSAPMPAQAPTHGARAAAGASAAGPAGVAWDGLDDAALLGLARAALEQAAARLLTPTDVDDAGLTATVASLHQLESMVHAEKLRRVREVESRQAFRAAGSRNTTEFLMRGLGLTRGEAAGLSETAKAMDALPETASLLARGEIGAGQAHTVARKLTELAGGPLAAPSAELAAGLDALVAGQVTGQESGQKGGLGDGPPGTARTVIPDRRQLGQAVDEWSWHQGADVLGEREARAWRNRRAYKTALPDGSYHWQAWLDPAGSAHLDAALAPLARPHGGGDARAPGQRLADALVELAKDRCDRGDLPEVAAQRPHVILITTPQTLTGQPDPNPSLLDGHGPVSSAVAAQLACDADVTDVIVDRNGAVLDVGRTRRTPTRRQRAAVIARDRACVGCGAPATRCQIHHIRYWSQNGLTDLDNLVLVCWSCHHAIHHDRHHITRDPATGRYTLRPPDTATRSEPGAGVGVRRRQRP